MPDQAHLWRVPSFPGTDILQATYIRQAFRPHAHEEYAIGIIERGAQSVRLGGSRQIFAAGTLALINPGEVHTGQAQTEGGWTYRMLYPPVGAVLAALGSESPPVFRAASVNDPVLYQHFLALHRALEQGGEALELGSRWQAFLAVLTGRHAEQRLRPVPVRREITAVGRAQQILQACTLDGSALTLSELAEQAGLPSLRLLRAFKAATGLPPHAYQTQLRVERARSLLTAGLPAAEVAFTVGFYDQSHLGRFFRETYGVTPGQYAAATRQAAARTS
ncbi:AraC family transcriptional regulator [Deinococcus sp. UYEF24]